MKNIGTGPGIRKRTIPGRYILSAEPGLNEWDHPWKLDAFFLDGWKVRIKPGFMNGREVVVSMIAKEAMPDVKKDEKVVLDHAPKITPKPDQRVDVALTESLVKNVKAYLSITGWNDSLQGTASVAASGKIETSAATYPAFFKDLGVKKPVAPNNPLEPILNSFTEEYERKKGGTRRLMSADIVLNADHEGASSDVFTTIPETGSQVLITQTVVAPTARYPYRLVSIRKYIPIPEASLLDRLKGLLTEPNFTQLRMSRLWMVSPEEEPDETFPDERWQPYPQHFVFWNLNGSNKSLAAPGDKPEPIRIDVPLAGGVGHGLANALLSPVNDGFQSAINSLESTSPKLHFWNT